MKSFLGLVHLIIVVYVIYNVVKSNESTGSKVFWSVIVFLFPLLGLIAWYFLGPRKST